MSDILEKPKKKWKKPQVFEGKEIGFFGIGGDYGIQESDPGGPP